MAEEHLVDDEVFTHDDMTVLRVLMHEVKGLNAVSSAPVFIAPDDNDPPLELDFDQTI